MLHCYTMKILINCTFRYKKSCINCTSKVHKYETILIYTQKLNISYAANPVKNTRVQKGLVQ